MTAAALEAVFMGLGWVGKVMMAFSLGNFRIFSRNFFMEKILLFSAGGVSSCIIRGCKRFFRWAIG